MIRGPRHAVFLRDRTPTRHCAFLEDASPMNYAPSKLNVDSIRAAYPPSEHQMPRLLGSTVDPVTDSTTINRREEDGGTRWEPNNARMSLDELVPTSTPQEGTVSREKERESRHSSERFELKKKPVSKQPLPGFHQAFGSTEIGRFSRSEFFVNMVGESSGSGSGATADDGDGTDGGDDGDVSREHSMSETMENATGAAAATAATAAATAATAATATTAAAAAAAAATIAATTTGACRIFDTEDSQAAFAIGDDAVGASSSIGSAYCGQPAAAPRWHSPHVGAIGSEI